ncbi:MAG: hypothetical protein GY796_17675 [Chloroflexi bacterium]|nr:hypothetical protein [Chloroflexota bacterium]
MNSMYTALASRIEQTLLDLKRVVARTERQMQMASQTNDDAYFDAAALNLHGFYAGIKRTFEDIAQTMGESLPTGSHWHQNVYTFNFRSSSLEVLARDVRNCLTAVSTDLSNFIQFLHQLSADDD